MRLICNAFLAAFIGLVLGIVVFTVETELLNGTIAPTAMVIPLLSGSIFGVLCYGCFVLFKRCRKTESYLKYNDNFLQTIIKSAPIGIGVSRDRAFVYVNGIFCHMLGYWDYELIGKSTRLVYPDEKEFELVGDFERQHIDETGAGIIETRMKCKDGSIRHVILTSMPLISGDWEMGLTFTVTDITARKEMEFELKKSFLELEHRKDAYKEAHRLEQIANVEKTNFQMNMSHEIRTPLNGIQGMLQLLQSNLVNKENIETANYALESCRRLSNLLNDIIELTRIEGGNVNLLCNPFDPADVLETTNALFKPAARQKGLEFEISVPDRLPSILIGDDRKLQQILDNIVGNAVKFTSRGSVLVEVSTLRSVTDKCRLFIAVTDTGIGIPDDEIEHIFSPYTQVDGSRTRRHEGAGLGLAIVKKLVEMQGGKISVVSEPDKGTSIYLCLEYNMPDPGIDY